MTLIVAAGNSDYAVLAADTRLSWNGKLVDDNSAKVASLQFYDGTLISAYTGLAQWKTFHTREWLLSTLADVVQPWNKTVEALTLLANVATREFTTNHQLAELSAGQRKLSFVMTGFVDGKLVAALISNFEDHNGPFSDVRDNFVLTKIEAKDASGSWSGCFGSRSVVVEEDKHDLNSLIVSMKDPLPVKGKCHAMIVRAGPRASGAIGPNVLTATLPKTGPASSWYSAEADQDQILGFDHFHALAAGGGAIAIRGLTISAPGIAAARSVRRGRGGKQSHEEELQKKPGKPISGPMPKTIELPPAVARRLVDDMRAFHVEPNAIKRDEIAARQLHGLKQHYAGKLCLSDVKEMFEQMRDHAS